MFKYLIILLQIGSALAGTLQTNSLHNNAEHLRLQSTWQEDMLNVHNQARAEVGVPNLIYNSSLADQARQWADNCLFQHGGHDGAGQNLFQTSSTNQAASQSSATDCANAWVNEKQFFAGGTVPDGCCTNGFESCGHYTQVVWDTTTSVGCDYQDCSSNNQFARLWVCNYYPAGNIIGQKAFD